MTNTMLTAEQWKQTTLPFYTIEASAPTWSKIHRQIIVKWIEAHCGKGFVYWDGAKTYVFGSEGDRLMFKMWISDDPLTNADMNDFDIS